MALVLDTTASRNEASQNLFILVVIWLITTVRGRIYGWVDDQIDPEPGTPMHRAAMAARMLLFRKNTPDENSWSELDEAWIAVRRARVRRIKQRWRDRLKGTERRIGRLERKRR